MMPIDLFFRGYVRVRCPAETAGEVFEALRQSEISPKAIKRYEKSGQIHFLCDLRGYRRLQRDFPALPLEVEALGGLPILGKRLLCRPGLLVGLLLSLCLVVAARLFVWEVRVTGNEQIPTDELLTELSAAGLACGDFLPSLDGNGIAAALRQGDGRVSYATVNFTGTVACVQIREAVEHQAAATAPADLIAVKDGVITMPLAYTGECLVREGDVVRAGQVLVSGVLHSEKHGDRLTRASGQILARTTHTYTVTVPLVYEEKVYTGRVGHELSLDFFGFQGIFFKTTGNIQGDCDIIKNKEYLTLASGRRLPVGITSVRTQEYEVREVTRTVADAWALARAELEAQLAADSAGRALLERTVEICTGADGVTLVCTVICEEDIARVAEFENVPSTGG